MSRHQESRSAHAPHAPPLVAASADRRARTCRVPAKLATHAGASLPARVEDGRLRSDAAGTSGVQSFPSAAKRVTDARWTRQVVAGEWFAHGRQQSCDSRTRRHGCWAARVATLLRSSLAPQVQLPRQESERVRALASAACRAACAQPARLNGRQDRFSASSVRRKADALSSAGATSAALGLRVGGALVCRSYCESTGST